MNIQEYNRENPFPAPVLVNQRLSHDGSNKKVHHLELDISESGMSFEPGDSLGIWPENDPELIQDLFQELGLTGEESVTLKSGESHPSSVAFRTKLDLHKIPRGLLASLKEVCQDKTDKQLLARLTSSEGKTEFKENYHDILDVLQAVPNTRIPLEELVVMMSPITARLYSIASSLSANPGQVHLTIAVEWSTYNDRLRKGICSTQSCLTVPVGGTLPVFISEAKHFSLPSEKGKDIIMVGPGTGIAPFRGFLQHRKAEGDSGRNWLFFGDQHRVYDYLYEEELEAMKQDGFLTELDLAFSRDQTEKIYVQHLLWERSKEVWSWITSGAYFFVCGDARNMAKDVDEVLHRIAEIEGGLSGADAKQYIKSLRKEHRYLRDVY